MSPTRILCPVDFGKSTAMIVEQAVTLARARGLTLMLLHVREVPPADTGEGMLYGGLPADDPRAVESNLRSLVSAELTPPAEFRTASGKPADEILRVAKEDGAALIVMGTHGRSGMMRLLMGSVAEQVLRRAECPVLIVKAPASDAAHN